MKIDNCKLIHSFKIAGREVTYLDTAQDKRYELEIVVYKGQGFIRVAHGRSNKLIPLTNVNDIGFTPEKAEKTETPPAE